MSADTPRLRTDFLIIGGGVIGLATAHALAPKGTVLLLERHRRLGEELSTRNSGVIHAGLYYPVDSAKAQHCVRGKHMLYEWCAQRKVPHARTSKLIVARSEDDVAWLETCRARAVACGVHDLTLLSSAQLRSEEPCLLGRAALRSPSSGLIDTADFVRSLAAACRERGVDIALQTEARAFERTSRGWRVTVDGPDGAERIESERVVNAAGLGAARVAGLMQIDTNPRNRLVKGSYFRLRAGVATPKTALVYPAPSADGLGIHLTRELGGSCIVGPDTEPVETPDFDVDPSRATAFATDVSLMFPGVTASDLEPHFASVRPKLGAPGQFEDFHIKWNGPRSAVQLLGIESPGLTASLSIAAALGEAW